MRNIFIVIVLVFLSCNGKEAPIENKAALIEVAENSIEIDNEYSKTTSEEELENNNFETTSNEVNTTSEEINTTQDYIRSVLYKGTLNETIKISLYLNEEVHSCGGNLTILNAMYKYDNQDKWILLDVSTDRQKKNYCMVEDGFTGVLFLEENEGSFKGNWISRDTKKQFKVELENQLLDIKFAKDHTIIEELGDILFDDLLYSKNDC